MSNENRRSLPVRLREWLAVAPISVHEHAVMDALIYHTKFVASAPDPLVVWPSIRTIMLIAKCSRSKAAACLSSLRKHGYITPVGKTADEVVKYRIELGHYHAAKIRLPKDLAADPHPHDGLPPSAIETTPVHDVDTPHPHYGYKQVEAEQDGEKQDVVNVPTTTTVGEISGKTSEKIKTEHVKKLAALWPGSALKPEQMTKLHLVAAQLEAEGFDPITGIKLVLKHWPYIRKQVLKDKGDGFELTSDPRPGNVLPFMHYVLKEITPNDGWGNALPKDQWPDVIATMLADTQTTANDYHF